MAVQSGMVVVVDAGHGLMILDAGSGQFYSFVVPQTATVTRDTNAVTLGGLVPQDQATVTTDGGGNVLTVAATGVL